jgi:two-component system NtrC family sensor kinase
LNGNYGYLYVGLDNKNISSEVDANMQIFILMILTFLVIGISGAFFFSYLITKPIKLLEEFTQNLSLNNLTKKNLEIFEEIYNTNILLKKIQVNDEIDNLINTFKEMLTRLTQTHMELQNLQSQLIVTEKLSTIGVLAAGLAHDINNPITGVLNSIYRIKKNPTNIDQVVRYLDLMEESAKKIQVVITNLMNFTRKQDIEFTQINLVDVIDKSILLVSHKLNETNIVVVKSYNQKKYNLIASQHHLEQLFINLLINSIDAINQKSSLYPNFVNKQIEIEINELEDTIIAYVIDNGIGIEESKIQHIFQTFYTTKKNEGTGLGLSIVQNILNFHKAKIEIQSEFEMWTKVKIIFNKEL